MGSLWVAWNALNDVKATQLLDGEGWHASTDVRTAYRFVCLVVVVVTMWAVLADESPFVFQYDEARVELLGLARMSTFTTWHFTVIGLYFFAQLSARVGIIAESHPILTILYEIMFPLAILVSAIITWVLYPQAAKDRPTHQRVLDRQFMWPALVMHNANLVMCVGEAMLGVTPWRFGYASLPLVFGMSYVVFSWIWYSKTGIFYYFFMDWRWRWAPLSYAAVLIVLVAFSLSSFALRHALVIYQDSPFLYPVIAFSVWSLCRFVDRK